MLYYVILSAKTVQIELLTVLGIQNAAGKLGPEICNNWPFGTAMVEGFRLVYVMEVIKNDTKT